VRLLAALGDLARVADQLVLDREVDIGVEVPASR
jgi:hypothetical protein